MFNFEAWRRARLAELDCMQYALDRELFKLRGLMSWWQVVLEYV